MHRKQFYRWLKIGAIVFISVILLLLMVFLVFDIHARKLYLHLFPRPALSTEVLENYWTNPLPFPDPMLYQDTQITNGEDFCVSISSAKLWTAGDEAGEIQQSVQQSFELYIDGIFHYQPIISMEATLMDMEGGGSIGGGMLGCIELEGLTTGLHSAEVQCSNTQGKIYSYTWAFKVTS